MTFSFSGGRSLWLTDNGYRLLDQMIGDDDEVCVGDANGIDRCVLEWYRKERHGQVRIFYADWNRHKLRAGPIRNREMAKYVASKDGTVVLFPGGRGTASMFRIAKELGLRVIDLREDFENVRQMRKG